MPEHKTGKKNRWTSIFFLLWDYVLHHHLAIRYHIESIAAVFFKEAAVIIAIHGQKTLHWQLGKVILSGMYNYNFEAEN